MSTQMLKKLMKFPPVGTLLAPLRSMQNTALSPSPKDGCLKHYQFTPTSPLLASCRWRRGDGGEGVLSQGQDQVRAGEPEAETGHA